MDVSQDVVNKHGGGGWEGEGVGEGAGGGDGEGEGAGEGEGGEEGEGEGEGGGEGEGEGEEGGEVEGEGEGEVKEREKAREKAREKVRERVEKVKKKEKVRGSVIDPGLDGSRVGLQRAHHGHEEPFHGSIRVARAPKQKLSPQRDLFIRRIIVLQEGVEVVHHGPRGRRLLAFRQLWASLLNLCLLRRALGAPQDH